MSVYRFHRDSFEMRLGKDTDPLKDCGKSSSCLNSHIFFLGQFRSFYRTHTLSNWYLKKVHSSGKIRYRQVLIHTKTDKGATFRIVSVNHGNFECIVFGQFYSIINYNHIALFRTRVLTNLLFFSKNKIKKY